MTDPEYPWYAVVEGDDLSQGDIIPECPVVGVVPPDDIDGLVAGKVDPEVDVSVHAMIVLTQACDLAHDKVDTVVLSPVWSLDEFAGAEARFGRDREKDKLREGVYPAYHMINACAELERPISVVDFHRLYTTPKAFLRKVAASRGRRPRLLPPYREHLAQAFARYFMRVGLPVDIPRFKG